MCTQEDREKIFIIVKKHLESHHMLAYDNWIQGFVDYAIQENREEILEMSIDQWVLNDLKLVCPGSLPQNLDMVQVLNRKYMLQINGAIDISVPAYQQYLKLKAIDTGNIEATTNVEDKIASKRMYKLDLTDGQQCIEAIEYETVSLFNSVIIPGSKILIAGPVQCKKGMLLLTDKSVEKIVGEVSDLYATHSLTAQLTDKLNMREDENTTAPTAAAAENVPSTASSARESDTRGHERNERTLQNRQIAAAHSNIETSHRPRAAMNNNREPAELPTENCGKRQLEIENTTPGNPEKKMRVDAAASNPDEYPDDEDLLCHISEDDDLLRHIDERFEEEYNKSLTREPVTGPKKLAKNPYVYIKQIKDLPESEKMGKVYRVKGQVLKVLTNLTLTDKWNLKCTITDGTGCLDVDISSDILSGFLRYTPQDINIYKKNIATKPDLKEGISSAFKNTADSLQTLYCIIEVTVREPPVITGLVQFEDTHVSALIERFRASGVSAD